MKLKGYGISNKCQRVVVNGESSKWYSVDSGVPQGSVLGPLLFILYANDIPDIVDSKIEMFVGDIKIYTTITSFREAIILQNDLDN